MVSINLNDPIKVKLTDLGKDIYYHRYDSLNAAAGREVIKPHYPKVDADGYSRFPFWDFIHLYGNHIRMAAKSIIEPLEIVYEGDENKSPKSKLGQNTWLCDSCRHLGKWDYEKVTGRYYPCMSCRRRAGDYYEEENKNG